MSGWEAKPGRIACAVIGCRRTAPKERHPEAAFIICYKCRRTARKRTQKRYDTARRLCVRAVEIEGREFFGRQWDRYFWKMVEEANAAKVGIR